MHKHFTELPAWLIYPTVIICGITSHGWLKSINMPLFFATYLPVLISAGLITVLEFYYPQRTIWQAKKSDVFNDLLFIGLVQVALPSALSLLVVLLLINPLQTLALPWASLWPHHWSIGMQTVLLVFSADFLRYWLHRAAHNQPLLWRLHAVHHSPDKLYWLNVGRFHPIEKSLQFLLDTLPFMLFKVNEQVFALYFVFYSINGFFQHSNVRLRFGYLNYLISSAELHRWHHSRLPAESNNNYGNNVSVWDWLFGTAYLPASRQVGDLGLRERDYPQTFLAQLRAPFKS